MGVARDFNPWLRDAVIFIARRANASFVRPPGDEKVEAADDQGLKSLATFAHPPGEIDTPT